MRSVLELLEPKPEKATPKLLKIAAEKLTEQEFVNLPWCILAGEKDPESGVPTNFQEIMTNLTPYKLIQNLDMSVFEKVSWILALAEDPKITLKKVKEGINAESIFSLYAMIMERFTIRLPVYGDESESSAEGNEDIS